jgi:hypothetical protein
MPKDKEAVVKLIRKVVSAQDRSLLRPDFLRGL